MAKCSRYMARVLRVVLFVLFVQVALSCALIPGEHEHEGLLGRFLLASQEKVDEIGTGSLQPSSVSSIFPLADKKVCIYCKLYILVVTKVDVLNIYYWNTEFTY